MPHITAAYCLVSTADSLKKLMLIIIFTSTSEFA